MLRETLRGRHFDVLMHMQVALRASLLSTLVPARIKLGFDRTRARELQWLFTTDRIRAGGAAARAGLRCSASPRSFDVYEKLLRWDIPLPESGARVRASA